MIVGILLLYIGMRCDFPTLYLVGCWFAILTRGLQIFFGLINGAYKAGKDGK